MLFPFASPRSFRFTLVCIALGSLLPASVMEASDWPQFRGPSGNGMTVEASYPLEWSESNNLAWTAEVPGGGWSSPIVVADRLFLTTAVSEETGRPAGFGRGVAQMGNFSKASAPKNPVSFEVHCLSLTDGKELWKQVVDNRKPPFKIHPSNTYATESPATDGQRIFVYFGAIGVVACLDLEGKEVWRRDLGAFPTGNGFGSGSSLAIEGQRLFVQCDNDKQSFLTALDTRTGKELWRNDREGRTSWSSPLVWKNRLRTELVACGSGYVTSYDLETGETLWQLNGMGGSFSSSPASDEDRIYFGNSGPGSRGPLVAVNAGAEGLLDVEKDIESQPGIAWMLKAAGPGMASPVVASNRLYVVSNGILACLDAATGERLYRDRLPEMTSAASSLWVVGDKLFILGESGKTAIIKVGDAFEIVGENLIEGLYWSTPSVAGDALLIRSATALHCIRS